MFVFSHKSISVSFISLAQYAVNCCTGSLDGNDLHCTRDGCVLTSSYEEARTYCLLFGMRLCTLNELESRECCSKGCGFDSSLSWTSDRRDDEETSGGVSFVDNDPGFNSLCAGNDLCQDYAAGILCTVSESVARYVQIHFFGSFVLLFRIITYWLNLIHNHYFCLKKQFVYHDQ